MEIFLLCFLVGSAAFAVSDPAIDEVEKVEFVTRVSGSDDPADDISVEFDAHGQSFQLNATRNFRIQPDCVPVMFVGADGTPRKEEPPIKPKIFDNNQFFGGSQNGTTILLKRTSSGKLSGHVTRNNVLYELEQEGKKTMVVRKKRESLWAHEMKLRSSKDYDDADIETIIATRGARVRRRNKIIANIEGLVMVDYSLWRKFYKKNSFDSTKATNEIKQYFAYVIHGVDLRFQNINDPTINIFITLAGYVIAKSPQGSSWYDNNKVTVPSSRNQVDVNLALNGLVNYIQRYHSSLPKHDHAFSFSDLDLTHMGSTAAAGYAPVAGICSSSRSVSLSESHGGFKCISIAAHELGHNLGARHDGGSSGCAEANHIMDPNGGNSNLHNTFYFSSCSVQDFKNTLGYRDCLKDPATHGDPALWAAHMARLPGQMYTADDQCQQLYGQSSSECQWAYSSENDKCRALWCKTTGNYCGTRYSPAAKGTDCGTNKWCINGNCVTKDSSRTNSRPTNVGGSSTTAATPPTTKSTTKATTRAPTGGSCEDTLNTININGGAYSCSQMALNFNSMCKTSALSYWCCKSCTNIVPRCRDNASFSVTITDSSGRRVIANCTGFVQSSPYFCTSSYVHENCCTSCRAAGYP